MPESTSLERDSECAGAWMSTAVALGVSIGTAIGVVAGAATSQWWLVGLCAGVGTAVGVAIGCLQRKTSHR